MKEFINLNLVKVVRFIPRTISDEYFWKRDKFFSDIWFYIFGIKDKIKRKYYIAYYIMDDYVCDTAEEFNEKYGERYIASTNSKIIWKKPHVEFLDAMNKVISVRYFDKNKDAQDFFDKIVVYSKEHNLSFIDVNAEKY